MAVGLYDWAIITDHREQCTYWIGEREEDFPARALAAAALPLAAPSFDSAAQWRLKPGVDDYRAAFAKVQEYILAGDCYQVNLARPFRIEADWEPWATYRWLRELSPAPFGAYLDLPFGQILSNSPERFVELREGQVETRPIKGTRPRRSDPEQDRYEREALAASLKDRAENVMIVDLLRNDLGKTCLSGSIKVEELCSLESYASVHHLVSSVRGRLPPEKNAADLLRGCLPGGSITGAPKRRAMEIIQELEPERRGVYCGAIGYLGYDGGMDTNIAIRTLVRQANQWTYWAGGGIVADSTAEAEFEELYHKAAACLRLFKL
ncbi:aminodeoxychorismate synthase component I [Alkalilimnicola ehrlichii]|uniref:aminodeoxychorismate synthase component I n=1 Tax=Alkalilimnicola ehrlichii TaxID=351052 RepID=UPI00216360FD|nr:aminodeoxychorismate synthase component I [Alkalilimnicola ehrlichii]